MLAEGVGDARHLAVGAHEVDNKGKLRVEEACISRTRWKEDERPGMTSSESCVSSPHE